MQLHDGEANGFYAFSQGKEFFDNPYNDAKTHDYVIKYKAWCSGYRKAKEATVKQRLYIRWVNSMWHIIDEQGNFITDKLRAAYV
jgi:hypothetical protein